MVKPWVCTAVNTSTTHDAQQPRIHTAGCSKCTIERERERERKRKREREKESEREREGERETVTSIEAGKGEEALCVCGVCV